MMSVLRAVRLTMGFVVTGAVTGAAAGVLSLAPIWLGLTPLPRNLIRGWSLLPIVVVGAVCGSVVMPVLGWLVIQRVSFWRGAVTLLAGAVAGENIAALLLWSLQSDVLIVGAFLGVLTTTLAIRLIVPPRVSPLTEA